MGFALDTDALSDALRLKLEVTTRELPEVLNHAGRNLALRAVQFSATVSPAEISSEMQRLVGHQIAGRSGRRFKRPRPILKPTTLARGIIAARLWRKGIDPRSLTAAQFDDLVNKMVNARRSSTNFLKSGWLPASKLFGAPMQGVGLWEEHGSGQLATADDLFAKLENSVPAEWKDGAIAYQDAERALQESVDFVAKDILVYVDEKLAKAGFTR